MSHFLGKLAVYLLLSSHLCNLCIDDACIQWLPILTFSSENNKTVDTPPNDEQSAPPAEEGNAEKPQDEEDKTELAKQEMLVQYLTDAHYFALKIEEAIDVISNMMYESASSGM